MTKKKMTLSRLASQQKLKKHSISASSVNKPKQDSEKAQKLPVIPLNKDRRVVLDINELRQVAGYQQLVNAAKFGKPLSLRVRVVPMSSVSDSDLPPGTRHSTSATTVLKLELCERVPSPPQAVGGPVNKLQVSKNTRSGEPIVRSGSSASDIKRSDGARDPTVVNGGYEDGDGPKSMELSGPYDDTEATPPHVYDGGYAELEVRVVTFNLQTREPIYTTVGYVEVTHNDTLEAFRKTLVSALGTRSNAMDVNGLPATFTFLRDNVPVGKRQEQLKNIDYVALDDVVTLRSDDFGTNFTL